MAYLADLVATDRDSIHVVIGDQAGFHLARQGRASAGAGARVIDLPTFLDPLQRLVIGFLFLSVHSWESAWAEWHLLTQQRHAVKAMDRL